MAVAAQSALPGDVSTRSSAPSRTPRPTLTSATTQGRDAARQRRRPPRRGRALAASGDGDDAVSPTRSTTFTDQAVAGRRPAARRLRAPATSADRRAARLHRRPAWRPRRSSRRCSRRSRSTSSLDAAPGARRARRGGRQACPSCGARHPQIPADAAVGRSGHRARGHPLAGADGSSSDRRAIAEQDRGRRWQSGDRGGEPTMTRHRRRARPRHRHRPPADTGEDPDEPDDVLTEPATDATRGTDRHRRRCRPASTRRSRRRQRRRRHPASCFDAGPCAPASAAVAARAAAGQRKTDSRCISSV